MDHWELLSKQKTLHTDFSIFPNFVKASLVQEFKKFGIIFKQIRLDSSRIILIHFIFGCSLIFQVLNEIKGDYPFSLLEPCFN